MKGALLALMLTSAPGRPAFDPPNTAGCRDKFDEVACRTDADKKGTCISQLINTPDFSVPGPPKFSQVPTRVCVATATAGHSLEDLLAVFATAAIVLGLVVYNMFRRRSLSDYD